MLVTLVLKRVPSVRGKRRVQAKKLERGFHRVTLHFGFAETLDVPKQLLKYKDQFGCAFDETDISYFIGREVP